MKRIAPIILTAAFICLLCGCNPKAQITAEKRCTDRAFSELADSGTDGSLEIARAEELLFRVELGELSGMRAQNALDARAEALMRLKTDAALAYLGYCRDVTDDKNRQRYDDLYLEVCTLECLLVDTALRLSQDPALKDRYDLQTVERLRHADTLSDRSALPLIKRERVLLGRYESLPAKLLVEYRGRSWTGDGILSDPTLSEEDFAALYEAYMQRFNAEAGEIYTELVRTRREIAAVLGFGSYADYAYERCNRSVSPQEAMRFSERVREHLTPVLHEMGNGFYAAAGQFSGMIFLREPTMDRIGRTIESVLPELSGSWESVISNGMFDFGAGEARMPRDFAIRLPSYDAAFLFGSWTNGFDMPPTVIRTFAQSISSRGGEVSSLVENASDLTEIDVQGLELLTVLRYDTLYGNLAAPAETAELFYTVYTAIDGCVGDAFQQFAYASDDLSTEALNAEYGRLAAKYGLDLFGAEARSWTQNPDLFFAPLRSIGTAAGAIAALELYLLCGVDPEAAKDGYRAVLNRENDARFSETLAAAGLHDPFSEETVGRIANLLEHNDQKERTRGK